jgi:hypothetical protein
LADSIAKAAVDIPSKELTAHDVSIGNDPYATMFLLSANSDENASAQPLPHRYVHNLNQDLATRAYNTQGLAPPTKAYMQA